MQRFVWGRIDALALVVLAAAIPFFFGRAVLFTEFFFLDDLFVHFYPHWAYSGRHLAEGQIPLWCPEIFCGYPIAANPQFGPWYPPNWLCFVLFSPAVAINLVILAHYLLALAGTYAFGRRIGMTELGAFISSAGFGFSGLLLTYHVAPQGLFTLSWLPVVLYFVDEGLRDNRHGFVGSMLGGLSLGLMLLAGHIQLAIYALLLIAAFALYRFFQKRTLANLAGLGCLLLPGFGLFAVQLLPALELISLSARAGAVADVGRFQYQSSVGFKHLIEMWVPDFYGGIRTKVGFSYPSFIGVPVFFLALMACIGRKVAGIRFFAGAALIGLLLAAGKNTPLYDLLFAVFPAAKMFKTPNRALCIVVFSCSILAGLGASSIVRVEDKGWRTLLIPAGAGLLCCAWLVFKVYVDTLSFQRLQELPRLEQLPETGLQWTIRHRPAEVARFAFFLIGMCVAFLRLKDGKLKMVPAGKWHAALVLLSLWVFGRSVIGLAPKEIYEHRSVLIDALQSEEQVRFFHMDTEDDFLDLTKLRWDGWPLKKGDVKQASETLRENLSMVYGVEDFFGFSSLPLHRFMRFRHYPGDVDPLFDAYAVDVLPPMTFLRRANCRFFVIGRALSENKSLTGSVMQKRHYSVHHLKGFKPRARVSSSVQIVPDGNSALLLLYKAGAAVAPVVEAEEGSLPEKSSPAVDESPAEISIYQPCLVDVSLSGGHAGGFLVLADTRYPGWKAWNDGKAAKIYAADYLYRGVRLSDNAGTVRFVFDPVSVKLGLFLSLASAGGLAALLCLSCRRRRNQTSREEAPDFEN